jgi:hypothetical protein
MLEHLQTLIKFALLPVLCLLGAIIWTMLCVRRMSRRHEPEEGEDGPALTICGTLPEARLEIYDPSTGSSIGVVDPFDETHDASTLRSAAACLIMAAQEKDLEKDYIKADE